MNIMSENQTVASVDHDEIKLPQAQIVSCGELTCEFLVNPIPRPKNTPIKITIQPKNREVILISNTKPNSTNIMRHAQVLLRERGITVKEEIEEKANSGVAMPPEMLERICKEQALVLCGVSD